MPARSSRARKLWQAVRLHLSANEDDGTRALSRRLRAGRRRGYLTKGELIAACRWKSPRSAPHVRANTHHRVRAATAAALATRNEAARLESLVCLRGVSVPTASAILMLLDPARYGVIDIRVWKLLHGAGAVRTNRDGVGFATASWLQFLGIIRARAAKLRVSARAVERTLFEMHRARQRGRLYRRRG